MTDNLNKLDLQIVNLEKIWNVKLDARFDAFMIMMSRNQQNQQNQQNQWNQWNLSSFSQIEISSDESITFNQTFKLEKIEFFNLKLNTSLDERDTIFLKKKIWI